jgi:hypothetical protein
MIRLLILTEMPPIDAGLVDAEASALLASGPPEK